jgi:hypothetical protein
MNTLQAQCDLKGADAWTVACECAALGDPTMLDDLKAGLKIHNITALIYEDSDYARGSRDYLKEHSKFIDENHWRYHACKKVTYGSFYGMAPQKMSEGILKDSYSKGGEPVWVDPKLCAEIQQVAVFTRYPGIKRRFKWYENILLSTGRLATPGGHIRTFQGRKADWKGGVRSVNQDTLREALATLPQWVTTWSVKKAIHRAWYDRENYNADGSLKVRILLTVHDSLLSALDSSLKEWAKGKLREWFANEVEISGIRVTIPFSGTLGADWGMKECEAV